MDVNKTDQMVKEQITKDVEEFSMISADVQNGAIESMDYAFDTEPEMKKQFNTLSLIGLGFAIACSWAGFSSSASAALLYSGTSGMVYAFPIASFFMGIIALGMAEMSSTFPSSSGQQHWVYMLSPEKFKIPLSYFAGWISMLSWWFIGVSVSSVCANMILSLAQLNNSDYVQQKWHLYVTYLAVYWTCVSLNIIFSAVLSLVNNVVMTFSLVSVIATFIAILICHYSGFRSTHFVWAEYTNNTGWDSNGLTFLLAIANAIFSLLGIDGAAHLTDEITLPAKYVPKAMVYSSIMGFFTAWPFIIALSYLIKDVDSVLNSSMAITEIYFQSLGSASGATFLMCLILFTLFGGLVAGREAASRITRAFAVDGGLPFSSFLSKIDRRFHIPVNAMLLEGLFVSLYGVIMLGSNVAFSSIINTLSLFLIISYTFPQVMLLIKGRNTLPKHYFDLGRFGYFVNYTSVLFTSLFIVILCYPSYKDVSATNMNWVAVSFVGLSLIIVLMWFAGLRNTYRGPILDVEKITLLREEPFAGIARD